MLILIEQQITEIVASPNAFIFVIALAAACAVAVRATPDRWQHDTDENE